MTLRTRLFALPLFALSLFPLHLTNCGGTTSGKRVRIVSDRTLKGIAAGAIDVRWASPGELYLTEYDEGVLKLRLSDFSAHAVAYARDGVRHCFTCSRLAVSGDYLLTAFDTKALAWTTMKAPHGHPFYFDNIIDVDLQGDRLVLLGSRRENGVLAPDRAIAWSGRLGNGLSDFRPILVSAPNAGPDVVGRCGFLGDGAVRFRADGSFLVMPGVEPGVFLFGPDQKVRHIWETEGLGILDRCSLPPKDQLLYMRDPEARYRWLKDKSVVDDILPLDEGPALLTRYVKGNVTHWRLIILHLDSAPRTIDLPFTASTDTATAKADLRGNDIVFLLRMGGRWRRADGAHIPGRIIVAQWK